MGATMSAISSDDGTQPSGEIAHYMCERRHVERLPSTRGKVRSGGWIAEQSCAPQQTITFFFGARGRNRTGMPFGEGFSYQFGFHRQRIRSVF
jgi:hypothetical protein